MNRGMFYAAMVIMLAVVLQGTLIPHITIYGGQLNLVVIAVVCLALHYGSEGGLYVGLFAGLLADIILGRVIGIYAIPLVAVGFLTGQLERIVYKDLFLVPVVLGVISTLTFDVILLGLSRYAFGLWMTGVFVQGLLPNMLFNAAVMPLAFKLMASVIPTRGLELS